MIDARLAYRNRDDATWKYYASSLKRLDLKCVVDIVSVRVFVHGVQRINLASCI